VRYKLRPMSSTNILKQELERKLGESPHVYAAQRAYVALMLDVIGRLLVAGSDSDEEIKRELAGFPEGFTIGFSVMGDSLAMRLRVRQGKLERLTGNLQPDLEIIFKHVSHAFMVFSFQESTPRAFANQRMITQGDPALAMRFTRCLNRVQALSLPRFVVERALKAVPTMSLGEKLSLGARLYLGVARSLV
jgi:hypothetical protein